MKCPECKGKGYIKSGYGHTFQTMMEDTEPCLTCEGSGSIADELPASDGAYIPDDNEDGKPTNSYFNKSDKLK